MGFLDWIRGKKRTSAPTYATNEEWLEALRGPEREQALAQLRPILVRGLRAALADKAPRQADDMAEDVAQEALLKVLDNLDTFRGESKLTTWAQKIAVRLAFSKLRRKRWENVALEDLMPDRSETDPSAPALSDTQPGPEEQTSQRLVLEQVKQVIEEELTERQRTAIAAIKIHGMPVEEVARRMDTNRNALYKLIHDARKRLKERLRERGLDPEELIAELERT